MAGSPPFLSLYRAHLLCTLTMTENMSNDSPTTKKRKANDGRATTVSHNVGGGLFSSWLGYFSGRRDDTTPTASSTCDGENLTQKIDTMMQIMSSMEKKLTTVSSLESRCANLEAKCSKLEYMLETKTNSIKEHVDCKFDKQNEYNSMLVRNQTWEYSPPVHSFEYWERFGYDGDTAEYLAEGSEGLKRVSEKMRRGEFPSNYPDGSQGIDLDWAEEDPILDDVASMKMRPHWREFSNALKQFTPAFGMLPDGCESYFILENIQLVGDVPFLLKNALMNKPFQKLSFVNRTDVGDNDGMSADSIMNIIESNKHLRKLTIGNNRIQLGHMEKICSAVRHGSIVELDLKNCFENGLGDAMIASLLTNGGLAKLQRLGLGSNGITSNGITLLANFLATNPPLHELYLGNNGLSGDCVVLLANALRSNTTLRILDLCSNIISDVGREGLRLLVHGDGNLNSIADSNHSCDVVLSQFDHWNDCQMKGNDGVWHEAPASFNRARKI